MCYYNLFNTTPPRSMKNFPIVVSNINDVKNYIFQYFVTDDKIFIVVKCDVIYVPLSDKNK